MNTKTVTKNDILEIIYFITAITQKQNGSTMRGALSSKGDLMGGIFDRWINTVPESIIFNKIILPTIDPTNSTKIISDFYLYDPKKVGIAPDVIGLRTSDSIIPFAIFDEKWKSVANMPQIEVKTFKKTQKMISLRNQQYDDKYLVLAESSFRIDYLLPFFDQNIFSKKIHKNLDMDNSNFIISNSKDEIQSINQVDLTNTNIGEVTLLKITDAKSFMDNATHCEGTVSIQYINRIKKENKKPSGANLKTPLQYYCEKMGNRLFKFNSNWYGGNLAGGIPYYIKNKKTSSNKFLFKTVDLYVDNITAITVIKKSKSNIYIEVDEPVIINSCTLKEQGVYKIDFSILDRSSNNGEEYFMQKTLSRYLPNSEIQLKNQLEKIISGGK